MNNNFNDVEDKIYDYNKPTIKKINKEHIDDIKVLTYNVLEPFQLYNKKYKFRKISNNYEFYQDTSIKPVEPVIKLEKKYSKNVLFSLYKTVFNKEPEYTIYTPYFIMTN